MAEHDPTTQDEEDRQKELAVLLAVAVLLALQEDDEADVHAALMVALNSGFVSTFVSFGGSEADAQRWAELFAADMSDAVALTVPTVVPPERQVGVDGQDGADGLDPIATAGDTDIAQSQVDLISGWFATATIGAATLASSDRSSEKTWVTRLDDAVRNVHRTLHGDTIPFGDTFTVATSPPALLEYPGQPVGPPEAYINCRCVLRIQPAAVIAALHDPEDDTQEPVDDAGDPLMPRGMTMEDMATIELPWWGVLIVEGKPSGDRRQFEPGALTNRELPLPLSWQKVSAEEHGGSTVVGRVDSVDREGSDMVGEGVFIDTPETDEAIGLIADGGINGISADIDSFDGFVAKDDAGNPTGEVYTEGRISGAHLLPIPAFQEATIHLGPRDGGVSTDEAITAGGVEAFKVRGAGWVTNPKATKRIHDYWTVPGNAGYNKVGFGTPGDFRRLRAFLSKYIEPRFLNATTAQWSFDALGYWPGERGKPGNPPKLNSQETAVFQAEPFTLTAGAPPSSVDHCWFENPELTEPTPLTITADGRVFGHLAAWGVCHISFTDRCVLAPKSKSNYAYFHLGAVGTDEGKLAVGKLTLGTGHADKSLNFQSAVAHYDNTGTMVAHVRAGEDKHGIWIAGTMSADATDDQRNTMMAAGAISGDWRGIGGSLELVGALGVNVPGFPIPQTGFAASGGEQTSLVAAGVVVPGPDMDAVADLVLAKLQARDLRAGRLAEIRKTTGPSRVKALAELL